MQPFCVIPHNTVDGIDSGKHFISVDLLQQCLAFYRQFYPCFTSLAHPVLVLYPTLVHQSTLHPYHCWLVVCATIKYLFLSSVQICFEVKGEFAGDLSLFKFYHWSLQSVVAAWFQLFALHVIFTSLFYVSLPVSCLLSCLSR